VLLRFGFQKSYLSVEVDTASYYNFLPLGNNGATHMGVVPDYSDRVPNCIS
jgi:hypothetical protein